MFDLEQNGFYDSLRNVLQDILDKRTGFFLDQS